MTLSLSIIRKKHRPEPIARSKKTVKMHNGGAQEEPMELGYEPSPASGETNEVIILVKWSEGTQPQKCKVELEKALQTWLNKSKREQTCKVLKVSQEGTAVISIKPALDETELWDLSGQTLPRKDEKSVTIMSATLAKPGTQILEDVSMNLLSLSVPEQQKEEMQLVTQNSFSSLSASSTAEEKTCPHTVPLSLFWYVNHTYKEEILRIERENGVKLMANVSVTFNPVQKDGGTQKAISELISLVQNCSDEIEDRTIPLKCIGPELLKNTLKIIERPESKLLLTLCAEEMTIYGPKKGLDAISTSCKATQETLLSPYTSAEETTWESQDTLVNIDMRIRDPFIDTGLTVEESSWRQMTTHFSTQIAEIKTKFGVDFKESVTSQGKLEVKAYYKRPGGNMSLESHAVRALLHLYQKIATIPKALIPACSAIGFRVSQRNLSDIHQSEGAFSEPVLNTEAPTGEGATPGDNKDETCPICMDTFTNKKQLECKHDFCEQCLEKSVETQGAICPVCKHVFGVIEGDQPYGTMSAKFNPNSLPGFPECGTTEIHYFIPSGIQTGKHPNPGKPYSSICRVAYLPDNKEGREVLRLLRKAFDQKLIFTIGVSRTTGMENQVTWNDIHHKTAMHGGPERYGYPDPGYLSRVRVELKAKGIE